MDEKGANADHKGLSQRKSLPMGEKLVSPMGLVTPPPPPSQCNGLTQASRFSLSAQR